MQWLPKAEECSTKKGPPSIPNNRLGFPNMAGPCSALPTKLPQDMRSTRNPDIFITCTLASESRGFRNTAPWAFRATQDFGGHPSLLIRQMRELSELFAQKIPEALFPVVL